MFNTMKMSRWTGFWPMMPMTLVLSSRGPKDGWCRTLVLTIIREIPTLSRFRLSISPALRRELLLALPYLAAVVVAEVEEDALSQLREMAKLLSE
jgi:hypothetical protein